LPHVRHRTHAKSCGNAARLRLSTSVLGFGSGTSAGPLEAPNLGQRLGAVFQKSPELLRARAFGAEIEVEAPSGRSGQALHLDIGGLPLGNGDNRFDLLRLGNLFEGRATKIDHEFAQSVGRAACKAAPSEARGRNGGERRTMRRLAPVKAI